MGEIILPHGGYRDLKSFQSATLVYDMTFDFCEQFVKDFRLRDQMVHAARSGRQNIAEGCQASGTSKKTEIKLVSVARASLEELLLDFQDWIRQHSLALWEKGFSKTEKVRKLAYQDNRTIGTYKEYLKDDEGYADTIICIIHQTNYLLDRQLQALEVDFLKSGGFTERLYNKRNNYKNND